MKFPHTVTNGELLEQLGHWMMSSILDIRGNQQEYAFGHIQGAISIPHLGNLKLVQKNWIPTEKLSSFATPATAVIMQQNSWQREASNE